MAILPTLRGIECQILINGKPASELRDTDAIPVSHPNRKTAKYQARRTVSTYIESITDQNFAIKLRVGPPVGFKAEGRKKMAYTKIGFHATVDGVAVSSVWCARPWFSKQPKDAVWEEMIEGVFEGKGRRACLSKFRFAKIETSNTLLDKKPAEVKEIAKKLQKLGVIEVRVYSEDYGRRGGVGGETTDGFLDENDEVVPEKALKGDSKSHGTALDGPEFATRNPVFRTNKKDGEDYPLVIFRFLYRSKEALKQLHIVKRTPSPSPALSRSPTPEPAEPVGKDGLTDTQRTAMKKMRQQFEEDNKKPKSSSVGDRKRKRNIKKEQAEEAQKAQRAAKRANANNGKKTEIDLTGHDEDENAGFEEQGLGLFVSPDIHQE